MAKKMTYIATVQILVEASDESTACDVVSACLSENLKEKNAIVDWSYINKGAGFEVPQPYKKIDLNTYSENTFVYAKKK